MINKILSPILALHDYLYSSVYFKSKIGVLFNIIIQVIATIFAFFASIYVAPISLYLLYISIAAPIERDRNTKIINKRINRVDKTSLFIQGELSEMYKQKYNLPSEEVAENYVLQIKSLTNKLLKVYEEKLPQAVCYKKEEDFEEVYSEYKNCITDILNVRKELETISDEYKNYV